TTSARSDSSVVSSYVILCVKPAFSIAACALARSRPSTSGATCAKVGGVGGVGGGVGGTLGGTDGGTGGMLGGMLGGTGGTLGGTAGVPAGTTVSVMVEPLGAAPAGGDCAITFPASPADASAGVVFTVQPAVSSAVLASASVFPSTSRSATSA